MSKEKTEQEKDENLVSKTVIECEKTEESNDGTTHKLVESHLEATKVAMQTGGVLTTKTSQITEQTEQVITNVQNQVDDKMSKANDKIKDVRTDVEASKEKIEGEVKKVKDGAVKNANELKASVEKVQKPSREFVNAGKVISKLFASSIYR